jgi:hypothetical protein
MLAPHVIIPHATLAAFCQRHHIRKLALFGSVLGDDFTPESDLDVLVEFEPDHIPGWEFMVMQDELSTLFGRAVDLNTAGFLSKHFRDDVLKKAAVIYEGA